MNLSSNTPSTRVAVARTVVARSMTAVATATLLLFGAAGCSGSGSGSSSNSGAASATPQPEGAAKDLTSTCTADAKGVWTFSGTLKNSSDKASTYTTTLSVAKAAGSTVVAQKKLTEKLAPKATKKVEQKAFANTKTAKGYICVVGTTVERG